MPKVAPPASNVSRAARFGKQRLSIATVLRKKSMSAIKPTLLGNQPSFGFGDRLGSATPGHLQALKKFGGSIKGIFAQQSIREMTRTNRTATDVMAAAIEALRSVGFQDTWGADADHLKTPEDVRYTADAGFVFYTIDPSGHVDQQADDYDEATLQAKFNAVQSQVDWVESYQGKTISVTDGLSIEFDTSTVQRAAVKYGLAIQHAISLGQCIQATAAERNQPFEIELSVDETEQPTTLAEHYIIADQCRKHGLELVSLAPRFVGDFEKGVDFKGDLAVLEKSMQDHAAIANELGGYKLSLHSGSDKLSMYPLFGRATQGRFHVKTAGTSYLEALRVVARCAPTEFREIVNFSRDRYETDKATYHVSATLDVLAPSDVSSPEQLEQLYLERWEDVSEPRGFTEPGRQILHCTFGSVLTDERFGPLVHQILQEHANIYTEVLTEHFGKHLQALNAG